MSFIVTIDRVGDNPEDEPRINLSTQRIEDPEWDYREFIRLQVSSQCSSRLYCRRISYGSGRAPGLFAVGNRVMDSVK